MEKFKKWGLSKTKDSIGFYHFDKPLIYYKKIDKSQYILFTYRCTKYSEGFDCRIATYSKESHIGKKHPVKYNSICTDFELNRDFSLIESYFIN